MAKLWSCVAAALLSTQYAVAAPHPSSHHYGSRLSVDVSVAAGLLNSSTDGRLVVMFGPVGEDPNDNTDVIESLNWMFGKNVYDYESGDTVTLAGGSYNENTTTGVWGWHSNRTVMDVAYLDDVPAGTYSVRAFVNRYDKVTRSDGSVVSLRFPCGDGALPDDGVGSLTSTLQNVTVTGQAQTVKITLDGIEPGEQFTGSEIGGCYQGNYEDTQYLKYVKIRSTLLSDFWGRDMYVGANVLLPHGYNANDTATRYPVVYSQGHWPGGDAAFRYGVEGYEDFTDAWDSGVIPATNTTAAKDTPKLIIVTFRHESPYYDDSYAANTANLGPYGDALNDELLPVLDATFNTIPKPYARLQEGGSTGGWESIANLIFRPDLFGYCFTSYPDSLSFKSHQAIPLYTSKNAYVYDNGSNIPDIREPADNGTVVVDTVTGQENHWELVFGTNTRSYLQWDVWFAVFGAQALTGYPLDAWDQVTGEIYPGAVEYWKKFDLADVVTDNWNNSLNLGYVLKDRIHVYVGEADTYYLNLGVHAFQDQVSSYGGPDWANFTYFAGKPHGGNYQLRPTWDLLEFYLGWINDHSPNGTTPLSDSVTVASSRGNKWEDVIAYGGHGAALARQAPPEISTDHELCASVGRWDPGVTLEAQWFYNGRPGRPFAVEQGETVKPHFGAFGFRHGKLQLAVTGRKRAYPTETRKSNVAHVH